jgi:hypothetical protein
MHNGQLEDQLRRALRAEADSIPFHVTSADIHGRLHSERRLLMTRAFAGLAAAFVIVAGAVLILATRPPGPQVATSPTPSSVASPSPTTSPSASPSATAAGERPALGAAGEAIVYRMEGTDEDAPQPDIAIFAAQPDGELRPLGTIKGSTLPKDVRVSRTDLAGGSVLVSVRGYVAVRFQSGGDSLSAGSGVAIYDLQDLAARPGLVDGARWMVWGPGDRLAVFSQINEPFSESLTIFDANAGSKATVPLAAGITVDRAWAADGRGLVARRDFGADLLEYEIGVLKLDGTFEKSALLPALYQRTGLERPYAGDGRRADIGCDQSGSGSDPKLTGCVVAVHTPDGGVRSWRAGRTDRKLPARVDWNSTGTALWGVVDPWPDQPAPIRRVALLLLTGVEKATQVATVRVQNANETFVVGLSSSDRDALVLNGGATGANLARVDTSTGRVIVVGAQRLDGFAGWATEQEPYPGR